VRTQGGRSPRGVTQIRTTVIDRTPLEIRLLERDSELATVTQQLAALSDGGRLLAIEGPPGIGKTTLIAETKALGQEAGLLVLGARGSELERSFSYGVVRQLFEPLLASMEKDDRAVALAGAAALAAPLFDPAQVAVEPSADSSLATLHGLYWLTANLAARRPLLLALDDLHWCDLPSLRFLAYLLPRVEDIPVLVAVGLRPEEQPEHPGLLAQIVSDPVATLIRPALLSGAATTRLLREMLSRESDEAFCAACWEVTAGNPLLLRELVHVIADEGLAPTEVHVPELYALAARAGSRTVSLRLSRLPQEATALAQAVAILGDDVDPRQAAALAELEERAAFDSVDSLVRGDVLYSQPRLGFVHPLIRAAVYEALTPLERERWHSRAARLLADDRAEPERVAVHLLRSPAGADPQVVATLREAAHRASARGASESAVAYLRRALAEPPEEADRADLLVQLGSAEAGVDGPAAIEHLRAAHELLEDPIRRAQAALVLGRQLFLLRGEEAGAVFVEALDELAGADGELERLLEVGLITNDLFSPALHESARERLERVRARDADQTVGDKLLLALLAYHDARAGGHAADAVALAHRALAEGVLVRANASGALFPACTVLAMADLDEVLSVYDDLLAEAHRRGSVFAPAAVKVFRSQTLVWRGDLGDAEADAREAIAGAAAWGASARFAGHASAFLADALMEQGRLDEAAEVLARPGLGTTLPDSVRLLYLRDSSARLRILRGDLTGGLAELLDAGRGFDDVGSRNPAFIAWRSQAALVLHQLDELEEARRLADEELQLARAWGAPRALGAALRAAGLIEGGSRGLELLGEAVRVLDGSPAKLEHAKARTELGAALRRANRRSDARKHLRQAVELATICGATALAARAESELLATGARPRRIALSGVDSLTPSERRVAALAAEGPTNREIAQALFVTQRTVEVHLTSIYRKLAISSRSQLAAALADAPGA
jgi:DNA-binding CsgD family transcriptional regulator/tetratricopeptide (TPR) repeat protein